MASLTPKRIMIMIGTNNSGHGQGEAPENTFNDIKAIIQHLRQAYPDATITLVKIFPRDTSPFYLLPAGKTLNKALLPDLPHPNKEGHRIWVAVIAPSLCAAPTCPKAQRSDAPIDDVPARS